MTVLQTEVEEGLLQLETPADNCLCYMRELTDLPKHVVNELTTRYSDINTYAKKPHPDETARQNLVDLKTAIAGRLGDSNFRKYQTTMMEYILNDTKDGGKSTYLKQFCHDFVLDMKVLIDKAKDNWENTLNVRNYKLYKEVLQHAKMCGQRSNMLVGRRLELEYIEKYVKSENNDAKPLVIHGKLGVGKSAIMAKAAKLCPDYLGACSAMVMRFLGITTDTTDLKCLLHSLCIQLCIVYNLEIPPKTSLETADQLAKTLANILDQVSKFHGEKQPLVVMLIGLQELSSDHRAHSLYWLPMECRPFVRIIVSVDSAKYGILDRLQRRLQSEENFVEVCDISEKTVEDIFVRTLQKRNRQLTTDQRELLLNKCRTYPHPIYTNLTASEALTWGSYYNIPESMLPGIVEDALWRRLVRLENKYSPMFVETMLSYLAVSPFGLTESELRDALSCCDAVLQEILTEYNNISEENLVMPSYLLSRLLNATRQFMNEREVDGKLVLTFHHPLFRQVCLRKYFGEEDKIGPENDGYARACKDLAEVFLQENGIKRGFITPRSGQKIENMNRYVTSQPLEKSNIRKLKLVPYFIVQSGTFVEIRDILKKSCLCNFHWLHTKLQGLPVDAILSDFNMVAHKDADIVLVKDFFVLNHDALDNDPNSLATYLVGCMPRLRDSHKFAMDLVKNAMAWLANTTNPVLIPQLPCFPSAHDMCKAFIWGVTDIVAIDSTGCLGIMRCKDGTAEIWNLNTKESVCSLGVRFDRLTQNIFCSEKLVLSLSEMELKIWEIESGCAIIEFVLNEILGDNIETMQVLAHSMQFEFVAVHSSDEDFNQSVHIINTATKETHKLTNFDLKDEFYKQSGYITEDNSKLVFVNARSVTDADDSNTDLVHLNVYDLIGKQYICQLECGSRKFHSLLVRDQATCIVCWADASFDMYDIVHGNIVVDMTTPSKNLVLQMCSLSFNNNLAFLASRVVAEDESNKKVSMFSSLWQWDVEELEMYKLLYQEHEHANEVATKFLLPSDFNVAILASPKTSRFTVWDTIKKQCIRSILAHTGDLTSIFPSRDPFTIYSTSVDEGVIKVWSLHRLLPKAVSLKLTEVPMPSILIKTSEGVRRPKSRKPSRARLGSAKSNKSVRFPDELTDDDTASNISEMSRRELAVVAVEEPEAEIGAIDGVVIDHDLKEFQREMSAVFGVNMAQFTRDSRYVITSACNTLPGLWSVDEGRLLCHMDPHSPEDMGTSWVGLASADRFVVGLCTTKDTMDNYPHVYTFRVTKYTLVIKHQLPVFCER